VSGRSRLEEAGRGGAHAGKEEGGSRSRSEATERKTRGWKTNPIPSKEGTRETTVRRLG
jgi:hypothetical protein